MSSGERMSRVLLACLAVSLAGCGTIFDPAPYSPLTDKPLLESGDTTPLTIFPFKTDASDAQRKLQTLANGYAEQRDDLMRQQLIFDVPMIGLGVAAIVNPLYDGAKNVTLGLGLGAAGAAGARIYFGPQAKVAAYNAAWLALTCASLVADSIAIEKTGDGAAGPGLVTQLSDTITKAEGSLTGNPVLLAAYNQARVSLAALQTALGTLNAASSQLAQYALTVISTATNKVLANVQNVSAATAPVAAAARPAATHGPAIAAQLSPKKPPDSTVLTLDLQNYSAQADAMSQRINAVTGALPKCTPAS
jgi:hypothetical protein